MTQFNEDGQAGDPNAYKSPFLDQAAPVAQAPNVGVPALNEFKQGVLAYLQSMKAFLNPEQDGNNIGLIDRAYKAIFDIGADVFEAHDWFHNPDRLEQEAAVTEGHIGAVGNDHLSVGDIGKPLDKVTPADGSPLTEVPPPLFAPKTN